MSIDGVIDIMIHLQSFRNIDLYYQGLYYVQLSCQFDQPIPPFGLEQNKPRTPLRHPHYLQGPIIDQIDKKIQSRIFLLRYSDQTVKINQSAIFRSEIPLSPGSLPQPLFFKVKLMTSDLQGIGITLSNVFQSFQQGRTPNFSQVGSATFKIANPILGVNQFVPVVFRNLYSSVLTCSFHCMLLDYRLPCQPKVLDQLLFPGFDQQLQPDQIEKVYHQYVMLLALAHNKIRKLLLHVLKNAGVFNRKDILGKSIKLPLTVTNTIRCHKRSTSMLVKAPFTACIPNTNKAFVVQVILNEVNQVSIKTAEIRNCLFQFFREYPRSLVSTLQQVYNQAMRDRLSENVFKTVIKEKYSLISDENILKQHLKLASSRRKSKYFKLLEPLQVQDTQIFQTVENSTFLFEQHYTQNNSEPISWSPDWFDTHKTQQKQKTHLFFLVHGFMGTSYDMKHIRDLIMLLLPNSTVICSRANQNDTDRQIRFMGQRLASQVLIHLQTRYSSQSQKISFIGHSLGGLIIRAALPYLADYNDRFNLFLTLNSPHLGCLNGSAIIQAGMWMIMHIKKSSSLRELALRDKKNPKLSAVYSLAKTEGFGLFKYVILVGSGQDTYVPYESARIESEQNTRSLQFRMAHYLLSSLECSKLIRVDLNFGWYNSRMGLVHGRAAHVQALDSRDVLSMLIFRFAEAFIQDNIFLKNSFI